MPVVAEAHGLVQRQQLPIPQWLFAWAAAAVLVISFFALAVLWPQPRLEQERLAAAAGRQGASRRCRCRSLCGAIGVLLLVVTVLAGYLGSGTALDNWAPTFLLITFWVGMVFVSILFGGVYRAFSPFRALGRLLPQLNRPYPERLGRWPAAVGLFDLHLDRADLRAGARTRRCSSPPRSGYTVLTLAAQVYWGVETWSRYGEAFAVYFDLFARMSIWETRDGVLGVRRPLGGLTRLDPAAGHGGVRHGDDRHRHVRRALSQGQLWKDVSADVVDVLDGARDRRADGVQDRVHVRAAARRGGGRRASTGWASRARARSAAGCRFEKLEFGFVHTLVPIAAVYVAAHYLTFLVFEGQAITYLASDPFGQGWDLFGTVNCGIDYSVFPQEDTWYVQVAVVVVGHVAALMLAHDRALTLYGDARLAVRSQYWMLGVMVGFTSLALWLLAQAGSGSGAPSGQASRQGPAATRRGDDCWRNVTSPRQELSNSMKRTTWAAFAAALLVLAVRRPRRLRRLDRVRQGRQRLPLDARRLAPVPGHDRRRLQRRLAGRRRHHDRAATAYGCTGSPATARSSPTSTRRSPTPAPRRRRRSTGPSTRPSPRTARRSPTRTTT